MPNPNVQSSLVHHPEIAQQVGLVVADYALLERLFYTLYAILAPGSARQNLTDFYKLRSIRRQKQHILKLAKPLLDTRHRIAVARLLRRFSTAADRRTEVAHCVYLADETNCLRLQLSTTDAVYVPISADVFEKTFSQYHTLNRDLLAALALLASALGRQEKLDQAIHVLPRPPELAPPRGASGPAGPPTRFDTEQHKASLSRLGLLEAYYPEGY